MIFYASLWINKTNINHYGTFHSPHKSTIVTPIGKKCRTVIEHYKVNLPQNDQKTSLRHMKHHVLFQIREKGVKKYGLNCQWKDFKSDISQRWNIESFQNRRDEVVLARVRIGHTNITHCPMPVFCQLSTTILWSLSSHQTYNSPPDQWLPSIPQG